MSAGLISAATSSVAIEVLIKAGATTAIVGGLQMSSGMGAQRIITGQIVVNGTITLEFTMEFRDEAFEEFDGFGKVKGRKSESIGGRFS